MNSGGVKRKLTSKNARWLVLGGNGQFGTELIQKLERRQIEVLKPKSTEVDISDENSVRNLISINRPDFVLNAAAWTDVDAAELYPNSALKVNAIGPKNIANACRETGAKLIHISTDYVFKGEDSLPRKVNFPTEPKTVYGQTKLRGEENIRAIYPEGSWIIRTSWLFSAYRKNFVKTMTKKAHFDEDNIFVVDDQIGSPTFTSDLAERVIECVDLSIPFGTYHFSNSGSTSWFDFAVKIFELNHADPARIQRISSSKYYSKTPRPRNSVLSNECWSAYGFEMNRHWSNALSECIPQIILELKKAELWK